MIERHGLRVDERLDDFITREALPDTGIKPEAFWQGFAGLIRDLAPKNRALLEKRDRLQARIDAFEGEDRIFARDWVVSFPRDHL